MINTSRRWGYGPARRSKHSTGVSPMNELRDLLGDRYKATIQAAVLADNPEAVTNAQRVGGDQGQLMYLSAVDRLDRVLNGILPGLLAQAWDEGRRIGLMQADYEYGHRLTMPNLTNPYRQEG